MAVRALVIVFALLVGTAAGARAQAGGASVQKYPDVVAAKVQARGTEVFDFDATISSPYDTPKRNADAFRVTGKDGTVFGERILLHDHATEQPFTRDLHGVTVPRGVPIVVIQARDREFGYGGRVVEVTLPGRN